MLHVNAVSKIFGGLVALDSIDLEVEQGEIRGLIGPNGSGKTTLFNVITGYEPPTSGTIEFMGRDITRLRTFERAQAGISRTFQHIDLFKGMTVLENVVTAAQCHCDPKLLGVAMRARSIRNEERELRRCAEEILESIGLSEVKNERASSLPYGHQRLEWLARHNVDIPLSLLD
jgi:ABC-type branched-subunit amino acid transport system ATPase component